MLLPIEFTPELVKDDPPELAEKMISLHKKNTEFTTAIKSHDYEKICFLLEVGAPFSIFAINEDEKKKISPEAIKGLKNSYRDIFIHHIINYSFDENNEKIIELLADNFFFSSNNYLMMFRKCYFAKTKNLEKSLDFFSKIMNNYNDLKQYKFEFISAAMYNKNTDLFKQMVSIFEKYSDDMDDHSIPLKNTFNLSSQHQTNLNKDSLAYYYDNFFLNALDYQINKSKFKCLPNYTKEEAIDDLFDNFLSHHFYLMKRDKHYEKPIEIIKFLTNKYFHFSGIKEVDFIELKLAYSRVLHVENKFFVMVYESSQKRAKTLAEVSEGLAILKKNLKNRAVDDFLSVLKVVTEKNEPIFCFEVLKKMNIDMSYCAELALYAKINSNVGNESDFVNKINKI